MRSILRWFFLLVSLCCFSQHIVSGIVNDANGNPVFGATVQLKGTQDFTTTDFNGNYSIVASPEDYMIYSFLGYETVELVVGVQELINITLETAKEVVLVIAHHPYSINKIFLFYGVNYNTFGLGINNYKGLLPAQMNFDFYYASDFIRNTSYHYSLNRYVNFSEDLNLNFLISASSSNFKGFQYHSYKLETSKSLGLLQFNSKYYSYPRINLILGYMNYDGMENFKHFGYGLGLSRQLHTGLNLTANFINWNETIELSMRIIYDWKWSNWNTCINFKHLSDYNEVQLGVGYDLNFYSRN